MNAGASPSPAAERYGMVTALRDDRVDDYLALHRDVPGPVQATLRDCHFRNFTVFHHRLPDGHVYLFMYFEYRGRDFAADQAKMAACPDTRAWWAQTDPCQRALPGAGDGEIWTRMDEAAHHA